MDRTDICIEILAYNHDVLCTQSGHDDVAITWHWADGIARAIRIVAQKEQVVLVKLDPLVPECFLYLKEGVWTYYLPNEEAKKAYAPELFANKIVNVSARYATIDELATHRNMAYNPWDQRFDTACYPHCTANAETRGEAVFAARNVIDGVCENQGHGDWPFQSWGEDENLEAEICINFGRLIMVDQIVLYLRADFPHDNWWREVTFTFSDGTKQTMVLGKTNKPQLFACNSKKVHWIKMGNLIRAETDSPFPALTQWEVYGNDIMEQ